MKIKLLCAALCVCLAHGVTAQTSTATRNGSDASFSKDIVKINIAALTAKNISVQYEYVLNKKISLALGGRLMPMTAVPFDGLLGNSLANNDKQAKDLLNISRIGNVAITPEVRFYFGKGYGRGFYAAPYYRFASFSSNTLIVNYNAPNGPNRSLTLNGDLTAHAAGVLVGAQWFFGRSVVIDWWIAGAHYGISSGRFLGAPSTELSEEEQASVKKTINDLEVPLLTKTVSTTARMVEIKTNGAFGGVRAGVCFGVRF